MKNLYVEKCNGSKVTPLIGCKESIEGFTDIDDQTPAPTHLATFSQTKLDQVINELVYNEEFNHIDFIVDAWKRSKYDHIQFCNKQRKI